MQYEAATLQAALATTTAASELLDLGADWALVRVVTAPAPGQPSYRQTRLYRQTASGWVRAAPSTGYWGAPRRLETDYFVYHYYTLDEAAVRQAAARLDALYPALYMAFFPAPPTGDKPIVVVTPEQTPGVVAWITFHDTADDAPRLALRLASPGAYLAPVEIRDEDLLAQALALALLDELSTQAGTHYALGARWTPLGHALGLAALWRSDLPLAVWRVPVVRWLTSAPPSGEPAVALRPPEFGPALDAQHRLWMGTPEAIGIPVSCGHIAGHMADPTPCADVHVSVAPVKLAQLVGPLASQGATGYLNSLGGGWASSNSGVIVALATVLDYAAAAYGEARLPELLAAAPQHCEWETLVPAVFGISAAEFETGWHVYLAEQYSL
jgi:hypothetical protein